VGVLAVHRGQQGSHVAPRGSSRTTRDARREAMWYRLLAPEGMRPAVHMAPERGPPSERGEVEVVSDLARLAGGPYGP